MSPRYDLDPFGGLGFPRVSGDEPRNVEDDAGQSLFSPRERG